MGQHPDPDDFHDQDLDDELGRPVYQGDGLSVRELTAEELQRFLDVHAGQPAQLLGSGWATLDSPVHPSGGPWTPPAPTAAVPAEPVTGSLGSPGRSALAAYRRRRAEELAAWSRSLAWRAPLVAAAGLAGDLLAAQASFPRAGLVGLAVAALVGWRLRFRPSEQARTWQRGAHGERRTAHLLERLTRDGFVVFHDLAVPGNTSANVDHLVIGPSGVFVIDSKQWTGSVHQGADGLAWHNHYPLDRTLETIRWEAQVIGRLLSTRIAALVCVHGAHVQGGGLHAQGVAIVPAHLLRGALGDDRGAVGRRRRPAGHHRLDQPPPGRLTCPAASATGHRPGELVGGWTPASTAYNVSRNNGRCGCRARAHRFRATGQPSPEGGTRPGSHEGGRQAAALAPAEPADPLGGHLRVEDVGRVAR